MLRKVPNEEAKITRDNANKEMIYSLSDLLCLHFINTSNAHKTMNREVNKNWDDVKTTLKKIAIQSIRLSQM
jgi:hypothetical protein